MNNIWKITLCFALILVATTPILIRITCQKTVNCDTGFVYVYQNSTSVLYECTHHCDENIDVRVDAYECIQDF